MFVHSRFRIGFVIIAATVCVAGFVGTRFRAEHAGASGDSQGASANESLGAIDPAQSQPALALRELRARIGLALQQAAIAAKAARTVDDAPAVPPAVINTTLALEVHRLPENEAEAMRAQVAATLSGTRAVPSNDRPVDLKSLLTKIRTEKDPQARFAQFESYVHAASELPEQGQLTAYGDLVELLGQAQEDDAPITKTGEHS